MRTTRGRLLHRIAHVLVLAAVAGPAGGCQTCLEFGCTGGFRWIGLVAEETQQVQVRVETAQSVFLHTCTLGGDALSPEDRCVVEIRRLEPGSDEESLAVYSLDPDEVGPPRVDIRTFDPVSDDLMWTDASGPETVDVEVRADGTLVLEETYEPNYLEQSKGPGCGVCEHQDFVTSDLRD